MSTSAYRAGTRKELKEEMVNEWVSGLLVEDGSGFTVRRSICTILTSLMWTWMFIIAYGLAAEEIGPFHIRPDGKTLYLSPYSWNLGSHG
ncbi:hypothetical protein F3Y22_tig00000340pilonHSYRG00414 [Hibiscus syriacus]|uniref:Uncharacterized protein n=1 Tax=Hibiscus syriacus TaxID=106335 RepID=A0A6A3D8B9_HIBSY|nr:hypothetical protein F3Y22_tig00000340pilonHSYRG00414 [Hibiscus syriacus]